MGRMLASLTVSVLGIGLAVAAHAGSGESVVLQTSAGRLLHPAKDGSLRADHLVPGPPETFTLAPGKDGQVAITASDGRWLAIVPDGRVRAVNGASTPQPFALTRVEGNRAALRGPAGWLSLDPKAIPSPPASPGGPRPEQTITLMRLAHVPSLLQQEFARLIRKAVTEELGGKGYDKVRTRKKQVFVKVPAPTLKDLKRQRRERVLSMDEVYQVHAQLLGEPEIQVVDMPYLQGYYDPAVGALMFTVQATLPLDGDVRYKIPDVLSASTGFRTVVTVTTAGAIRSEKENGQLTLRMPELLELDVGVRELNLSNDALNTIHEALEEMINDELHDRRDRIRQQANQSIRKAVESQKFRSPMLEWLLAPFK